MDTDLITCSWCDSTFDRNVADWKDVAREHYRIVHADEWIEMYLDALTGVSNVRITPYGGIAHAIARTPEELERMYERLVCKGIIWEKQIMATADGRDWRMTATYLPAVFATPDKLAPR